MKKKLKAAEVEEEEVFEDFSRAKMLIDEIEADEDLGGATAVLAPDPFLAPPKNVDEDAGLKSSPLIESSPTATRIASVFGDAEDLRLDEEDTHLTRPSPTEAPASARVGMPSPNDSARELGSDSGPSSSKGSISDKSSSSICGSSGDLSFTCLTGGEKGEEAAKEVETPGGLPSYRKEAGEGSKGPTEIRRGEWSFEIFVWSFYFLYVWLVGFFEVLR